MPETAADTQFAHAHRLSMRSQAEAELTRSSVNVRFLPELERTYQIDSAAERAADLRNKSIFCAMLYVFATLLLNVFVVAQPVWREVAVEVALPPSLALLMGIAFFRRATPDREREAAALVASLVYTLAVLFAASRDLSHAAVQDLVLVTLPVSFVLVFIHLRLRHSVVFVVVSIAALAACMAVRQDLSLTDRSFPIGLLACLCVPSLFVVHNREQAARRIYLHALLQRLRIEHLSAENEQLSRLSTTDPLTGAANRRRLDKDLKAFCAGPSPHGAFLLIDLDGFKSFNDRHGHIAGDQCLQQVATCMASQLRRCDLLARFGGEEFAVLLPNIRPHEALDAAERLRQAVEATRFALGGQLLSVTISIGVADVGSHPEPTLLLGAADSALYSAKKSGRNRVCAAGEEYVS